MTWRIKVGGNVFCVKYSCSLVEYETSLRRWEMSRRARSEFQTATWTAFSKVYFTCDFCFPFSVSDRRRCLLIFVLHDFSVFLSLTLWYLQTTSFGLSLPFPCCAIKTRCDFLWVFFNHILKSSFMPIPILGVESSEFYKQ